MGGEVYEFDTRYYDDENAKFFAYHGFDIADYYDHEILLMLQEECTKTGSSTNSWEDITRIRHELSMNGTLFSTFEKLKFQKYRALN